MSDLGEIDTNTPEFGDLYDELPLWSAPFGLLLLEQVPLRPCIAILDVGAGTGFLTIELAQRCGPATTVIAVDPWESAMKRLRRKVDHLGLRNVRALVQDAAVMDLPDASVDLIVSNLGINNFDDPAATLRSCFRIARPGARLFLTTNLVGHMSELHDAYREVLLELGFAEQVPALEAHIRHRATVDSARALLEGAGFEFVEAVERSFQERFADGSALLRHFFVRLAFLPGWKSVAPDSSVEAVLQALERRLNQMAGERGELALNVPFACIQACKPMGG